jgi:hypothetical protein
VRPRRPEYPLQRIHQRYERTASSEQVEIEEDRGILVDGSDEPASEEVSVRPPDQGEARQHVHVPEFYSVLRCRLTAFAHVFATAARFEDPVPGFLRRRKIPEAGIMRHVYAACRLMTDPSSIFQFFGGIARGVLEDRLEQQFG